MTDDATRARADALLDQIEKLAREVRELLNDGEVSDDRRHTRGRHRFHGGPPFGPSGRGGFERNPAFFEGRNLSPEGIAEMHRLFEERLTPYAVAQSLGVSPRAAYLRHQEWLRTRADDAGGKPEGAPQDDAPKSDDAEG